MDVFSESLLRVIWRKVILMTCMMKQTNWHIKTNNVFVYTLWPLKILWDTTDY